MPGSLITHPIVPPPHRCPIRVAPQNPCSTHPDLPLSFQVSSEPLVFFALASPPFPASYPHLLIPESWPVGATHMALMRPSHIEIHTCKLGLYLRGTWMERDDYAHIDTYFFFSLSFSLDCELLEDKGSLSCSGPFLVPMDTNLPNNNHTQILCLRTLKRNGTNELTKWKQTQS